MPEITARIPAIDWQQPMARHWLGGDAVASHFYNALSLLFPQGEKYFIDVARDVADTLPAQSQSAELKAFVAQEAIHTRQHVLYNVRLAQLGYRNPVARYLDWLIPFLRKHMSPLSNLAMVCAYEHYTAVLGDFVLTRPELLAPAPADLALLWQWHAAEESEHKAVCFDLYRQAGGGWPMRCLGFVLVSLNFLGMFLVVFGSLLRRDGLFRPGKLPDTIAQCLRHFFIRPGVVWHVLREALPYCRPGFHPWQNDNRLVLAGWLERNAGRLRVVGKDVPQ
jgi:predicted metal-dependent hydrolase